MLDHLLGIRFYEKLLLPISLLILIHYLLVSTMAFEQSKISRLHSIDSLEVNLFFLSVFKLFSILWSLAIPLWWLRFAFYFQITFTSHFPLCQRICVFQQFWKTLSHSSFKYSFILIFFIFIYIVSFPPSSLCQNFYYTLFLPILSPTSLKFLMF